jgi:hypothetical protein
VEAYSIALQGGPGADSKAASGLLSRVGVMASQKACIEFALLCQRLATLCNDDPQLREHLLELAREWITMAERIRSDAG